MPSQFEPTGTQLAIMASALGVWASSIKCVVGGARIAYRNRYAATVGSPDDKACKELVANGMMTIRGDFSGKSMCFYHVAKDGEDYVKRFVAFDRIEALDRLA